MAATHSLTRDDIREQLRGIVDPCSESRGIGNDIIDMGLLDGITIDDGHVTVNMRLTSPACHMVSYFNREVEIRVGELEAVEDVTLETDSGMNWDTTRMTEAGRQRRDAYVHNLHDSTDDD
jgi:metal-sulfur cluster biosynthetic enzyme